MRPDQVHVYVGCWVALLLASLVVAVRQRRGLRASLKGYGRALRAPWKLVTYVLSAGPFIVLAPYSGDPTWDHVDASGLRIVGYGLAFILLVVGMMLPFAWDPIAELLQAR